MEPRPGPQGRLSRGPRITLTCECGERRDLRYGERWQCEQCGRTWDTHRIPVEECAAIQRIQRRFVVYGRIYAFVLLPLSLTMWVLYGRPVHRRRLRRALDRLPEWKIRPE